MAALEWKWDEAGSEWVAVLGKHEISAYRERGRIWQLTITDDLQDTPIFHLGEYPSADAAKEAAATKAEGWLRAAADALSHAPSPGKAGAFEDTPENRDTLRSFIVGSAVFDDELSAILAWARARSRAAEPPVARRIENTGARMPRVPPEVVAEALGAEPKGAGGEGASSEPPPFTFTYRNHRGEVATRRVLPIRLWFGATEWHPETQWLLAAADLDRGRAWRDFAVRDIVPNAAPPDLARAVEEARVALVAARNKALRPEADGPHRDYALLNRVVEAIRALDSARTRGGEESSGA